MTRRLVGLVAAVTLTAALTTAALTTGAPASGAATAPAAGTLLRATPMTAYVLPLIPIDAEAWKITYESRTALGAPTVVTGTVLVSRQAWTGPGARPLVGYAIGTQGLADRCAPSTQLANGTEYEAALVAQALSHGWAVALTDYPGLGTPGEHPYVVGPALGRAVLDSMRAARHLRAAHIAPHGPAGIYGYSEGGNAAGWAIELQPTYAPDVPLEGAALGAAPSNFPALAKNLEGSPFAFLLLYSAMGFNTAYPELHLSRYLNAAGRAAAAELQNSCLEDAIADGLVMPKTISAYTTSNPLTTPAWQRRLRAADLGTIAPHTPVLLGSAQQDEVIPYSEQVALYHQWCGLGARVRFLGSPLGEHVTGAVEFAGPAFTFLDQRFTGTPVRTTCT